MSYEQNPRERSYESTGSRSGSWSSAARPARYPRCPGNTARCTQSPSAGRRAAAAPPCSPLARGVERGAEPCGVRLRRCEFQIRRVQLRFRPAAIDGCAQRTRRQVHNASKAATHTVILEHPQRTEVNGVTASTTQSKQLILHGTNSETHRQFTAALVSAQKALKQPHAQHCSSRADCSAHLFSQRSHKGCPSPSTKPQRAHLLVAANAYRYCTTERVRAGDCCSGATLQC